MGVPSSTTNLSGFGCYMEELIEDPDDYGIYVVDRRMKSIDESIDQLADQMFTFAQKTRRQRINQRNRTERLSDLLDWKRMGMEYAKARNLSLQRAYPAAFEGEEQGFDDNIRLPRPISAPGSPRLRAGTMTPGDLGTLTEDMQGLQTNDYWGQLANKTVDDEDGKAYSFSSVHFVD